MDSAHVLLGNRTDWIDTSGGDEMSSYRKYGKYIELVPVAGSGSLSLLPSKINL
jgi:hypothetical protein